MTIQHERLDAIIEFAQQSARLSAKAVASVGQHNNFVLFEDKAQGRTGLHFNQTDDATGVDVWLRVERLHETAVPDCPSELLRPWLKLSQGPEEAPTLRGSVPESHVIQVEKQITVRPSLTSPQPEQQAQSAVMLEDYPRKEEVHAAFQRYTESVWEPWAAEEKKIRDVIKLYAQLFTLRQQLEGGLVETPTELIWGVGIGIWKTEDTSIQYPLITQAVEVSLNQITSAIEIVPRDTEPRLETDWYASVDNPGLAPLEERFREFFSNCTATFSPFDRATFEPLLRSAVTFLDPNGLFWPDRTWAGNKSLPKADSKLCVTDTWVLFARPRQNNAFVRDLEKFKSKLREKGTLTELPAAVRQLVSEPCDTNPEVILPEFRGVSGVPEPGDGKKKPADLYFPKPFNDEQVRLVQLLEVSDGVVVQGPPGTGKTHTIANVISHYLANGKRVLVTSMKEPALGVLRNALPDDIKPLAISLLTSEQEGMKQFEHAIHRIASEVQSLDRRATAKEIAHLEETIDGLHARLSATDREIEKWARANLEPIVLDGERISPIEAAKAVVDRSNAHSWLQDELSIDQTCQPRFGDGDIARLREARRALGGDIAYLRSLLPEVCEFPTLEDILHVHQDLRRLAALEAEVAAGNVLPVSDEGDGFLATAESVLSDIHEMRRLTALVAHADDGWAGFRRRLLNGTALDSTCGVLDQLGTDLASALGRRQAFLSRPVHLPMSGPLSEEVLLGIRNLSQGRKAFGALGFFGKSEQKRIIENVEVLGETPQAPEDWEHVLEYIGCQQQLRQLAIRWNTIARELNLPGVGGDSPEDGAAAGKMFETVETVRTSVELERRIKARSREVVPLAKAAVESELGTSSLEELEQVLQHHLSKRRLGRVWNLKQAMLRILDGKAGAIVDAIREFATSSLGNAELSDSDVQQRWSDLMQELSRIHALRSYLETVENVTAQIELSGAPSWAEALRLQASGISDPLLPGDWQNAWRHRRLSTHLTHIDQQERLQQLSAERTRLENQLAKTYKDVVVKRTWLKLAENASPGIRAALQAYLNAIQKIGKGTGKRALRYRQDARHAAEQANPAVPCWIMSHYRVSESIPAQLGCFDLVIIDEASQSDLTALPALLRAEKVLIVGDDKQVSPDPVGLEEEKVKSLMQRFLTKQVPIIRAQLAPDRSIYDLCKVVFASSTVMLKEHFRCVPPIIEYSKREFYNHELRPLRRPRMSERLDPPLVDVVVGDGFRNGDVNRAEVRFIVDEIKKIADDPRLKNRSIGVVSLLGDKQSFEIWQRLTEEIGPEAMERHQVACGDARTFQGKERSIMFLSMVCAPNEGRIAPLVRESFNQRFNVAASRAQDRMYLVRSVELEQLSEADRLRRSLISHFASPFMRDEVKVEDLRKLCESEFEANMYDCITERGYCVTPQIAVDKYRIDLVVEGANDARLAIECDGDRYHGPDKWAEDMQRQRVLERSGWIFWRCFASAWIRRREELLQDLLNKLYQLGIEPMSHGALPRSVYTEHRVVERNGRLAG